jgi:hypothetical protein
MKFFVERFYLHGLTIISQVVFYEIPDGLSSKLS